MRLGIIGYGNIGELICKNLEDINFLNENTLNVSNKTYSKIKSLNPKINTYKSNIELVKNSDIIFISVKSPDLINVLSEISAYVTEDKYIVHSSAGITFEQLSDVYSGEVSVVIPSIASWVNEKQQKTGISIFYHNKNVSNKNKQYIEELFSQFSNVITTDNYNDLESLTIVTSCMPAFIAFINMIFTEELCKNSDLNYDDVYRCLIETTASTTNILSLNVLTSQEIINKVATKQGITQKGLNYLNCKMPLILQELFEKLM